MIRRSLIPWFVLVVALALTAITTWRLSTEVAARDQARFDNAARAWLHAREVEGYRTEISGVIE